MPRPARRTRRRRDDRVPLLDPALRVWYLTGRLEPAVEADLAHAVLELRRRFRRDPAAEIAWAKTYGLVRPGSVR